MKENTENKILNKVNIKDYLNRYHVHKDNLELVDRLLNDVLYKTSIYRLDSYFRFQVNVPVLRIYEENGNVTSWAMFLCDIREVTDYKADIYMKGVLTSSLNFSNTTPFAEWADVGSNQYVVVSYSGYANLIKPKIK